MRMDGVANASIRRMGDILVERGSITSDQLAEALVQQEDTGRLLGEICIEQWGVDRLALADALSEQWDEMRRDVRSVAQGETALTGDASAVVQPEELRVLLQEAEAARAELVLKTDELERRLAVLEALVIGISGAVEELRSENR
jgi:hypothetical protein